MHTKLHLTIISQWIVRLVNLLLDMVDIQLELVLEVEPRVVYMVAELPAVAETWQTLVAPPQRHTQELVSRPTDPTAAATPSRDAYTLDSLLHFQTKLQDLLMWTGFAFTESSNQTDTLVTKSHLLLCKMQRATRERKQWCNSVTASPLSLQWMT